MPELVGIHLTLLVETMRWLTYLVFLGCAFATFQANSNPLVLDAKTDKFDLNGHFAFLRDPDDHLTLDDVANSPLSGAFIQDRSKLNFAVTTDVIWLRLNIVPVADAPLEWWLELAPAYIGEVTLYQIRTDSDGVGENPKDAGLMRPLSVREFRVRNSTFRISLMNNEPQVIYLRLRSNTPLNVRGTLWQPAAYAEQSLSENLLLGFYNGSFVVIFFIGAVRWLSKRNQLDLWWLVYLAAEGFSVLKLNGLAAHYFFPEFPAINMMLGNLALSVMVWAGAHFGMLAFGLEKNKHSYSYIAATWIGNLALLAGLARILALDPAATISVFSLSVILSISNCVFSYRFLKSKDPAAKFYFLGTWFMTACVVLVVARNFGFIPAYNFIDYIWQSNLIVHASLISFGMVLTQREARYEKRRASDFSFSAQVNLKSSVLQKKMVTLVSHEFRNLLAMLSLSMHALNKFSHFSPEVRTRHQNIARIHRQMRLMIDNFLMEERIQDADIKILYQRTDVETLIHEVVSIAESQGKNQKISADIGELPKYLWLDEGILRLTLTNLLDNAVKYSAAGSRISLSGGYRSGILRMSVVDSGIGMNKDALARICEPHFKADSNTDGIGIGLYMVKTMLQAHQGGLDISSSSGNGSTLKFWLRVKLVTEPLGNILPEQKLSQ